jgi:sugar phosphate isomerase/epimerase
MKLSFSTNAFVRHSVFEAVERIAAIGYDGVEILADVPHFYAHTVTDSDVRRLRGLLDKTNLQVANVNANTATGYYGRTFWEPLFEPSLANPDLTARKWRIDYSKKCIDLAHALGSRNVSLTSGRMVPGTPPEEGMDHLRESLEEVLEHAARQDVRIGIEYEPGILVECFAELASLIQDMDSPYLGANLDLGHSNVLGEDPEMVIGALSNRIFHIHLEDIRSRKHYHLIPGLGDMDFEAIFKALKGVSYQGFVTVELYTYPHQPEEAARRSLTFLKGVEQRLQSLTRNLKPDNGGTL